MARLPKEDLLQVVLDSLTNAGWQVVHVGDSHPYEIVVSAPHGYEQVLLYVWNITHGGASRSEEEYRIQITGVSELTFREGWKTVLLGIAQVDEERVIVAFDANRHAAFGASPSIQVSQSTLVRALGTAIALERKPVAGGNVEIVVAFRPEVLTEYLVRVLPAYHEAGAETTKVEGDAVAAIDFSSPKVTDEQLAAFPEGRRRALRTMSLAIRDQRFRRKVLHVYGHRCSICGLQGGLVQGAHIVAVSNMGLDDVRNGLALCALDHSAYDRGLIAIDGDYQIRKNRTMEKSLKALGLNGGLEDLFRRARVGQRILLPAKEPYYPDRASLQHNVDSRGRGNFE